MIDTKNRTFRLGDRVMHRVPVSHKRGTMLGDVIGTDLIAEGEPQADKVLVGWADGSQSWELRIELRQAAEL